jgi:hypothetical protein
MLLIKIKMPVITRSQSRKLDIVKKPNQIDEKYNRNDIRVYKLVNLLEDTYGCHNFQPAVAVLIIPANTRSTLSRKISPDCNYGYIKHRAECAFVENITDLDGNTLDNVKTAYSIYKPYGLIENTLLYKKGQFVFPDYYNENIDSICGGGIHFFQTINAVRSYYIYGSNNNQQHIKIYPRVSPIKYSFYKPYISNGDYDIYTSNGLWKEQIQYTNRVLTEYNFKHENKFYTTKFNYSINSITNDILVSATTYEKDNFGNKYRVVFDISRDLFPNRLI